MEHSIGIEGMSCEHCVRAVEQALGKVQGVENVRVSLENKEAKIEAASDVDMEEVKKAVEEEGYKVHW